MAQPEFITTVRSAVVDMAKSLEHVFKKYSRNTRTKAWKKLTGEAGMKEMDKILQDPNRPVNTFQKLVFKEWLLSQDRDTNNSE